MNEEVVRVPLVGDGGSAKLPGTVTVILTRVVDTLAVTDPRKMPADIELSDTVIVWNVVGVDIVVVMVDSETDVAVSSVEVIESVELVWDVRDSELSDVLRRSLLVEVEVEVEIV